MNMKGLFTQNCAIRPLLRQFHRFLSFIASISWKEDEFKKNFFPERVVKLWNRLPRQVAATSNITGMFKKWAVALSAPVWLARWCLVKGWTQLWGFFPTLRILWSLVETQETLSLLYMLAESCCLACSKLLYLWFSSNNFMIPFSQEILWGRD